MKLDPEGTHSEHGADSYAQHPHLFLAPCSNDHAQEHFQNTVVDGVEVSKHTENIATPLQDEDRIPIWGTGEGNTSAAEAMEPGDVVAFYVGDKTYSHIAVVRSVEINEDLAREIWRDEDGETWPYVMYLDNLVEIGLDSVAFHNDIGYDIAYPLGFTRVGEEKVDDLRLQYGSLERYFQQARARMAFEQGEELPIDMYLGTEDEVSTGEEDDRAPLEELRQAAEKQGTETTTSTTTSQTQYNRSEAVKKYAHKRADGVCEGCGKDAPFTSRTGDPYLEIHHVFEVSDEGPDEPDAVIALCPTCHRRVHHGEDGNEYNRELIETLDDIEEGLDFDDE